MATDCIRCVAVHRIDAVVSSNMSIPDGRTPSGHMPTDISTKTALFRFGWDATV